VSDVDEALSGSEVGSIISAQDQLSSRLVSWKGEAVADAESGLPERVRQRDTPPAHIEPELRLGLTAPNLVIAPVGANGKVDVYNGSGGNVQLIADVCGWFAGTPGPVTALTDTATTTSIALSWKNPAAASLTGVMIRRAAGAIPPASAIAGEEVLEALPSMTSFNDTNLTPGTQYGATYVAMVARPAEPVAYVP
jgi:hypothetical protein